MSKRLSPSGLQAKASCPCFDYRELTDVDGDSGETMAERGNRLHKAVATEDLELCKTDDEREQVQLALDYTRSLIAGAGNNAIVLREQHVDIPSLDGGTLDFAVIKDATAWLVDYKFIRTSSVVEPTQNLQLRAYAMGLFLAYPEVQEIKAAFIAPGMGYAPDPVVYSRTDLPVFLAEIERVRAEVDNPFKKPCTGEYCPDCANAARCPALCAVAIGVSKGPLGLPVPDNFEPGRMVSPRDRGIGHLLAAALENWADQVKKNNNAAARAGEQVMGHRIVSRSGGLVIKDHRAVYVNMQTAPDNLRLAPDEIVDAMTTTPKRLADVIATKYGLTGKEANEILKEWLEAQGLVERAADVVYLMRVKGQDTNQLLSSVIKESEVTDTK